ncbi:MAG: hypothetical protein JSS89_13380 [Bacteroidetes bacterium]|nr:hypothetical protein [Bacteroidota bacterium]
MKNEFKYDLLPQMGDGPIFSAIRRVNATTGIVVDVIPVDAEQSEQLSVLLEAKGAADRALDSYLASLF